MEKRTATKLEETKVGAKTAEVKPATKVEAVKEVVVMKTELAKEAAPVKTPTAKEAAVKTAVKETIAATKTASESAAKATEKKVAEKTEAVKETAKKVTEKVEKAKATTKKAVKKATEKKEEVVPEVFVQFQSQETGVAGVIERVKAKYVSEGHKVSAIKSFQVYVKPEEYAAYYVINGKQTGKVDLF